MNNTLKTSIALGMFALVGGVVAAQSGNDLFQQALVKERTDGNLTEVIALYEKIIQQHGGDRKLAAKALYQIGQAYEKLGQTEARKAYERIARDFADQKEVAADASLRLAALAGVHQLAGGAIRTVWSGNEVNTECSISADGRLLAMDDWTSGAMDEGSLLLRDMPTGQTRLLRKGGCGENNGKNCIFADAPLISPDGLQVAYTWYDKTENNGRGQLQIISTDPGAKPRTIVANPEFNLWAYGWSPDRKSLAVRIRNQDRTSQICWVSIADGSIKTVKSLEWRFDNGGLSVSPDGRYIAYAALATNPNPPPAAPTSTETHIFVLAADGSGEVALVKSAGISKSPLWTPDGSHIVFTSNLSGKTDLWSIGVHDGKAAGSPTLLKRDIGEIRAVGITKNGSYYYIDKQKMTGVEQIFVAELIPGGGSRTLDTFVGGSPSWSPDGKSIAFKRHRLRTESYWYYSVIRSVETGQETTVSRDIFRGDPPRWLHDGRSFLTIEGTGSESDGGDQWWNVVELQHGSLKRTIQASSRHHFAYLSPDDKTLYCAARDPNDKSGRWNRIVAVDVATGQERIVFRLTETAETLPRALGIGLTVSPDGKTLAFARSNPKTFETHLARVDVDGANYRELCAPYQVRRGYTFERLKWTHDGRSIFFAMAAGQKDTQIMRIASSGGTPEFTGLTIDNPDDNHVANGTFDVSPDGSRIAYHTAARQLESAPVLLAIDNLPALLNSAK